MVQTASNTASPAHTSRSYWRVLAPSLLVVCLLCALAVGSVKVLSAVRAYVGGESLWSKARNVASGHLLDYASSRDPVDYTQFETALSVPEGDRIALEEMLRPMADTQLAREGLLVGGNHPDDVDNMIVMFRYLGDQWFFKEALRSWQRGDELIDELRQVGRQLHEQVQSEAPDGAMRGTLLHLRQVNAQLLTNEKAFSQTLAETARLTERILIGSFLVLALLLSLGIYGMLRHALSRQAAQQQALSEANERWELAAACAELGLFELDVAQHCFHMDAKAAELHGLGKQPCLCTREQARELVELADRPAAKRVMDTAISTGQVFKSDYRLNLPDGRVRHMESTGRLDQRRREGGPRLIGVVRDVTDERARTQLAIQRDAAEKVAVSQRAFLSRLSHELRTPLNAILGFAQLLGMGNDGRSLSAAQTQQVQWILTAGRQLLSLVEDVLDLSKVEAGEIGVTLQSVDLQGCLVGTLPLLESVCQQRQVHILNHIGCASGTPLKVMADPQRLQQVFTNLLSNACKYNRKGGHVIVEARRDEDAVFVEINDSGIGLSTTDAAELFQPFKRIQTAANSQVEGTGLGLYIVKQLVERMGGEVSVSSQLGVGSRFTVKLLAAA